MFFGARAIDNDYLFFAGYTVLQFIVLATAWNILGGYMRLCELRLGGILRDGRLQFHGVLPQVLIRMPIPVLIVIGGIVSGIVGLGMGYLTLRLRGVFFAIATLALAVVLQTLVVNWDFVGGSRGAYVIRPNEIEPIVGRYIQYLFLVMLVLVVIALAIARGDRALAARLRLRHHPRRRTGGRSLRRADAEAEADRHHAIRRPDGHGRRAVSLLHRLSASRPRPSTSNYAVNSIAMPMIGGTTSWVGPLIGAILLGTLQQVATVTISSAVNLLIVGLLLIGFVIIAPNGIVGLVQERMQSEDQVMTAPLLRRPGSEQALRRLRGARRHQASTSRRASASA